MKTTLIRKPERTSQQVTGNVGLYYCCYRLSRLGLNVMPTARNARGIDLVAYGPNAKVFRTIQVKTLSRRNPGPLGRTLDTIMAQFWVIVDKATSDSPRAFVLSSDEVRELATKYGEDDRAAWWLDPQKYDQHRFQDAWHRITATSQGEDSLA